MFFSVAKNIECSAAQAKSLTQRIIEGSAWLMLIKVSVKGTGFISSLILARVLSPADFGVLGIALLATSLLEMFSQTGFDSALIQKEGDISGYLDSAWVVSMIRGALLSLIIFLSAPLFAAFFDCPKARDILRFLALCPLISGLKSVGPVFFRKELDFKKLFVLQTSDGLAYSIVALSAAFFLKNVWALALGLVASNTVSLIVTYLIHPYRPGFRFDLKKAGELFHFGKWMLGTQAVLFFVNRGDNTFVGKMLGTAALGFYAMAYNIAFLSFSEVNQLFINVLFPAYAKLQDSPRKLQEAYFKIIQLLAFLSIPVAGFIFIFAHDFTRLFLGEKWLPMVPSLKILALSGALVSIGGSAGTLLAGVGKPKITTKVVSVRLAVMAVLIYPLSARWGIFGTSLTVLISTVIVEPMELYIGAKESGNRLPALIREISIPFCCFTVIAISFSYVRSMLVDYNLVPFLITVPCIATAFLCLSYLSELCFSYTAFFMIRQNISRFMRPLDKR